MGKRFAEIEMGERKVKIRSLRIAEIRDLDELVTGEAPTDVKAREKFFFDLYIMVISWGLSRDDAKVSVEEILEWDDIDFGEIVVAYRTILTHAGLVPSKKVMAAMG